MPLRRAPLVAWLALSAVLANKDSPNSKFPHTFQVRPELEQAAPAPPSKAVCLRDRDYICNRHNPRFLCTCYQANNHHKMRYPSCDDMFKIWNVKAYMLSLRSYLPIYPRFFELMDEMLSKIVWDFGAIPAKYMVILRKRCTKDAMYLIFGFLKDPNATGVISSDQMQPVTPKIFLNNPDFMAQPYLPVLNVTRVDVLPPIVRHVPDQPAPAPSASSAPPPAAPPTPLPSPVYAVALSLAAVFFLLCACRRYRR